MIEADSRYAVSTQVTAACVVCSWCCTVVSTGITSDWSRANAATPSASTPNVTGRARPGHAALRHGTSPKPESLFRYGA